jgi:NAD(P)H-dependent FMN reductase
LKQSSADYRLLRLEDVPSHFIDTDLYEGRSEAFQQILDDYIACAEKFVFVIPEYNGGFPGILKTFIDAVPPRLMHHKKAGLIGLSSGHSGALRGMDQFTNVLNYLKVNVHHHKPKLSQVEKLLNKRGELENDRAIDQLQLLSKEIVEF